MQTYSIGRRSVATIDVIVYLRRENEFSREEKRPELGATSTFLFLFFLDYLSVSKAHVVYDDEGNLRTRRIAEDSTIMRD